MMTRRIIFMDGEFTKLTTKGVKFLSLAFITDSDEELYLEIEQQDEDIDKWVLDNVTPHLLGGDYKVSETEAIERIRTFVTENYGDQKPILVADVNQFDWNGLCELFGIFDIPFFYIPIDFSTILYVKGIDIDINRFELANKYDINIDSLNQHNALCDTRVLKQLWIKLY